MKLVMKSHATFENPQETLIVEYVGQTPESMSPCEKEIIRRELMPIMHQLSGGTGIESAYWEDECPRCTELLNEKGECPRQKDHDEVDELVMGVEEDHN